MSRSIAEQLAALRPYPSLLVEMPRFGKLASWDAGRGFGEIELPGDRQRMFCHVTGRLEAKGRSLHAGDQVLFLPGTDRRSRGKTRAVRWMRVQDLSWGSLVPPHDQASLDVLRRAALSGLSLKATWILLEADWYQRLWDGDAPADLDDQLLCDAWLEKVAASNGQELEANGAEHLISRSPYIQCRCGPNPPQWLDRLIATQCSALGRPDPRWMSQASPQQQPKLMTWALLKNGGVIPADWKSWFAGRQNYEVGVAEFIFQQRLTINADIRSWLDGLRRQGFMNAELLQEWINACPVEGVRQFSALPDSLQDELIIRWRSDPVELTNGLEAFPSEAPVLLGCTALAVDLESDGKAIRQVGWARNKQKSLIPDVGGPSVLSDALPQLKKFIECTPLLVGHNIIDWDWPILAPLLKVPRVLMWDTLLVNFLTAPQAPSHALGGAHRADEDALQSLKLFHQQLKLVPDSVVRSILIGEYPGTAELLENIAASLDVGVSYRRAPPAWWHGVRDGGITVLPERLLQELSWVPGVKVVSANPSESLALDYLEIDAHSLASAMQEHAVQDPAAALIKLVVQRANQQGISVRYNMLPVWLRDREPATDVLVRRSLRQPVVGDELFVAPMPRDVTYLTAATTEASALRLLGFPFETLVLGLEGNASGQPPQHAHQVTKTALLRAPQAQGITTWFSADPAAKHLEGQNWRSFRTVRLPDGMLHSVQIPAVSVKKPVLAARKSQVLHPGSHDQMSYWMEVLRAFRNLGGVDTGVVPILLVESSGSRGLLKVLQTALAELHWGESPVEYRSRSERMKRAAHRGLALVDKLSAWPDWQMLAKHTGVTLLPVVEALPIEQWFAASCAGLANDIDEDTIDEDTMVPDDQAPEGADQDQDDGELSVSEDEASPEGAKVEQTKGASEVAAVSAAEVLSVLPKLLQEHLNNWLRETGLGHADRPACLLDSRLSMLGTSLDAYGEVVSLGGETFSELEADRLRVALDDLQISREVAPSDFDSMEQFLVSNWKPVSGGSGDDVKGFKPTQRDAIDAIRTRENDVLITLPTGEGKSVLFQVPALCRGLKNRRLTLVLSPLKALMRDQVEALCGLGFADSVDYMSSDRPPHEMAEVIQGVLDHRIVLLYVAPERLRSDTFINMLRQRFESDGGLEYAVVDETHCVNQWGYEFRPDYFHAMEVLLKEFRVGDNADQTPLLLLSATITSSDKEQLTKLLARGHRPDLPAKPLVVHPKAFSHPLRSHIQVQPERVKGRINDRSGFELALKERLPLITQVIDQAIANRDATNQRSAVLVFVSKREHAEKVARKLSYRFGGRVDYFHAGLDAATREEIYQRFRAKQLDILVATKAFGMGMDIPDIHWVVHLSPPAFLEDYLQEVGRMGRGEQERKSAGLSRLSAALLFSGDDFESLRNQRARGALRLPFIKDQLSLIAENVHELNGQFMALVPQEGFDPPSHPAARRGEATKLRLALYWLERAGLVKLRGSVPNLLPISIDRPVLEKMAEGKDQLGKVAKLILEVANTGGLPDPTSSGGRVQPSAGGLLASVLEAIADLVGIFVGASRKPLTKVNAPGGQKVVSAAPPVENHVILNLPQLMTRCVLASLSEVVGILVDIETRGGLHLQRSLQFAERSLAREPKQQIEHLFSAVGRAARRLTRKLANDGVHCFVPQELFEADELAAADPKKAEAYRRAANRGVVALARLSGVRIRQVTEPEQEVRWEAKLAPSNQEAAHGSQGRTLGIATSVFDQLLKKLDHGRDEVSLAELVEASRRGHPKGRYRASDLRRALNLLSSLNLMSMSSELLPQSYILTVDDPNATLDENDDLWKELDEVNLLAERRNDAMEVFANLPVEAQSQFIEGYFAQSTSKELEAFLVTQLGNIESEADGQVSTFIHDKRAQLRAEEVEKFFKRYRDSEEPNQWLAICHPYNEHLLVNAGPGAGKTSVLVGRIVHLIREQHVAPNEIIVLAFNRAVVFEIKQRIRELFQTLGYGSYVKRVRVYTFHAFAALHLNSLDDGGYTFDGKDKLLPTFAQKLQRDPMFRQQVVGACRCILVDEFQDVTEDIYTLIQQLHLGSDQQAGVMVIGDDDQDILRWNRQENEFSEIYFNRFQMDFVKPALSELLLKVNFRSGAKIVEMSQKMISLLLTGNAQSQRLKDTTLLPSQAKSLKSDVDRFESSQESWDETISKAVEKCIAFADDDNRSLAILCKSNAEVAVLRQKLLPFVPDLTVQSNNNFRVAALRHVGLWLDILKAQSERENSPLDETLKEKCIKLFHSQHVIPEARHPNSSDVKLDELWDLCFREQSYPHISDLVRFLEYLKTDELARMLSSGGRRSERLISTIHKVKGREFDRVVVMPSCADFPFSGDHSEQKRKKDSAALAMACAEEARLLYVGMTRAKEHLTYYVGRRECAWRDSPPQLFGGCQVHGLILQGSHKEVRLGWACTKNDRFNHKPDACQNYIERHVRVGDAISVGGFTNMSLFHRNAAGEQRQVGYLAEKFGPGSTNSSLVVSAVVRWKPDVKSTGDFDANIAPTVRQRGWGYVVLVSGQLR